MASAPISAGAIRGHFHKGRRRQDQKTEQESRHRKLRPLPGRKQNADADGERKKEEVYPQRPAKDQKIRKRHQRKQGHGTATAAFDRHRLCQNIGCIHCCSSCKGRVEITMSLVSDLAAAGAF
ncbi:UNVERIFIED_ORG: hypothetical protein GGD47_001342 [Rhizobium etli]